MSLSLSSLEIPLSLCLILSLSLSPSSLSVSIDTVSLLFLSKCISVLSAKGDREIEREEGDTIPRSPRICAHTEVRNREMEIEIDI